MKNVKRILSCFICTMLTFVLVQVPVFASENTATGTQKAYIEGKDWGPAVTKTVIKLDKIIDADSVSKDDFTVEEEKQATVDWNTGEIGTISDTRDITNAYVSDQSGNKVTENSQYVTIEMYVAPNIGSPFIYSLKTSKNAWCEPYKLNVSLSGQNTLTSDGEEITSLNVESTIDVKGDGKICPKLDGFKMDAYTSENGQTIAYGSWAPQEDNHKNPLIIWLHGAGEGGTDPSIAVLGNRVTGLIDENTQSSMNGAYVLVPQVAGAWMDGYDLEKGGHSIYSASLMELIQSYVGNNTDIDTNRIYIGGCSNGGYMTLEMLTLYPDYFAAAYTICTAYSSVTMSDENLAKIKDMPIWFVYALNDPFSIADEYSRPLIKRLRAIGAQNIHVSEFVDVHDTSGDYVGDDGKAHQFNGHWSWIYAFNNKCFDENDSSLELFSWLAKQQKATASQPEKPAETTKPVQENKPVQSVKTGDNSLYGVYAIIMTLAAGSFTLLKTKKS